MLEREALVEQAKKEARKLVMSIKGPQPSEYSLIEGADLFTYLHLGDLPRPSLSSRAQRRLRNFQRTKRSD